MSDPSAVEEFVAGWPERRPFWEKLSEMAHDICKEGLKDRKKLKCHILHRTKEKDSLETKLKRMEEKRIKDNKDHYTTEGILKDMIDLAGIRILLLFPDDVQEVKAFLEQAFGEDLGEKSGRARFKGLDENGLAVEQPNSRFLGYRATHFLVTWRTPRGYNCEIKTNEAHIGKTVEVQVTTILMNAWQEAQHDITYKELSGTPSDDERALLEMINGLAHSGEVALRQVQIMQKRRVNEESRPFQDAYELTVWFKEWLRKLFIIQGEPSWAAAVELRHVVILFIVLQMKGLHMPHKLNNALRRDDADAVRKADEDGLVAFTQKFMQNVLSGQFHRHDLSLWAIMKVCVPHHPWGSISKLDAETKAFVIVGAINITHSAGFLAAVLESGYNIRLASNEVDELSRERMEDALFFIVCSNIRADHHKKEVNKLWDILSPVGHVDPWDSLLHASAALLASRMVFVPNIAADMTDNPRSTFPWPGEVKEYGKDEKASLWQAACLEEGRYVSIAGETNGKRKWSRYFASELSWCTWKMVDLNFIYSGEGFSDRNRERPWLLSYY